MLFAAVALGGCLASHSSPGSACFDGGWQGSWTQPGLYGFVLNQTNQAYKLDLAEEHEDQTLIWEKLRQEVGPNYRITFVSAGGPGARFSFWPGRDTVRFDAAFAPGIADAAVQDKANAFLLSILDDSSVAADWARALVEGHAAYADRPSEWYGTMTEYPTAASFQKAFENRTTEPQGLWAGSRWFYSSGNNFTIGISTATLETPIDSVKVDAGDRVTGPQLAWQVDSQAAAELHTREVFQKDGLPEPSFTDAHWGKGLVCPHG